MFLMAAIFVSLLVVTFAVLMILTRPTTTDRSITKRVAALKIDSSREVFLGAGMPEFLKGTKLSDIAWIDRLLQKWNMAHSLRLLIAQAESSWSVSTVLMVSLVLGGMAFGIARFWIDDLPPALVIGALAVAVPVFALRAKRASRLKKFDKALPDAVDLMGRSLRAGHSISAAIEIVAQEAVEPLRAEFREVYRQQSFGLPSRDAMLQLARRVPSDDLRFLVTAILVQKETGGNLVQILDRTSFVLRERLRIRGEVGIYTAQGRLTGLILCLLPVVMFVLISMANPEYTSVLLHDPTGRKITYVGLGLMGMGTLLIRKIVNIKV
ncbi:MAG: type II secretion system F family protein [Candidatus Korobacteraceae bacterium]